MYTQEELDELFVKEFPIGSTYTEISNKLKTMQNEYTNEFRRIFCNALLSRISEGYTKYNFDNLEKDELIKIFINNVKLLPTEYEYYHIMYHFFKRENKKCLDMIDKMLCTIYQDSKDEIKTPDEFMDEGLLVYMFFEPFKQAFDGFWNSLADILRKYPSQDGIPELCELIDKYYKCKTDEEAIDMLLEATQKYPKLVLIKELIGFTYYSMKMWNNAIAYFESVEETGVFFRGADLYFMMAWSYGKVKNRKPEEECYRKSLEERPDDINTLNNLGYCLYLQKKLSEAKTILEKCLELDESFIYSANNYVRVLIALGRNKDAKDFVKSGKYKISKDIQKRVDKLDNTNARIKKESVADVVVDASDENTVQESNIDLGIKRQQFSNEKLLEDELTARIESGIEVFGMKLKMYKRKGLYGRQFIIPIGRLDLLCEDDKGDLYVIELKKDSGYDDAYKQTAAYLDWFEKNEISKGKNVYGIICLNSPTKELIEKVHKDKRMKLFEYQISYTEV